MSNLFNEFVDIIFKHADNGKLSKYPKKEQQSIIATGLLNNSREVVEDINNSYYQDENTNNMKEKMGDVFFHLMMLMYVKEIPISEVCKAGIEKYGKLIENQTAEEIAGIMSGITFDEKVPESDSKNVIEFDTEKLIK